MGNARILLGSQGNDEKMRKAESIQVHGEKRRRNRLRDNEKVESTVLIDKLTWKRKGNSECSSADPFVFLKLDLTNFHPFFFMYIRI